VQPPTFFAIAWFLVAAAWTWRADCKKRVTLAARCDLTESNRAPERKTTMDVQTNEQLLINFEGYLTELVCDVKNMNEVNLVAEVLVTVQDALRDLAQKPRPDKRRWAKIAK
jgi:hypothetical protein